MFIPVQKKPINKYEEIIDYTLQKLKKRIMTHYKDVNLNFGDWQFRDRLEINEILSTLESLIENCKE